VWKNTKRAAGGERISSGCLAFDEIRPIGCRVSGYEIRAVPCRIANDEIAAALGPSVRRIACRLPAV